MAKRSKPEATAKSLAREIAEDSIVTSALARLIEQIIEEVHASKIKPLRAALKDVVLQARTSGGIAGPDAGLMAACSRAEQLLEND